MFLYGISYAVASLSCTIPIFIGIVSTTLERESFVAGVATFLAYGLGMGMTLAILTIAVALARSGIVRSFRRVLPHVNRISGGFLMLKGDEAAAGCETGACEMPKPSHPCGSGCGCFAGN